MTGMKAVKKQHFAFQALQSGGNPVLKYGDAGDDVRALQAYLTEAGYLRRDRVPGCLCDWTSAALRHFQKCYGLPDTGEADEETLRLITRPCCGVPDIGPDPTRNSGPAPFVLRGCKYPSTDLTYRFFNGTSDLANGRNQDLVRQAFAAWEAVSPLRFIEVALTAAPTFSIAWAQMNHGDGSAFDNGGSIQGNVLAHAFFPPPCGGPFSGALHFDEFDLWTDAAAPQAIRLLNVAIHEIGHLLGLDHSNNPEAIMFAFYDDAVDSLRPDDINGIQALHGRPSGVLPIRGELLRSGDNQVHRVTVPAGGMTVSPRGPDGQDFDLYVRAGLPPTRTTFDLRSFTASSNEEVRLQASGGEMFILVDSWRGGGSYEVQVIAPCRALQPVIKGGHVAGVVTSRGAISSTFVVDAAGGGHWLARRLGLHLERRPRRLLAYYGYVEGDGTPYDGAPAILADRDGWTWMARVRSRVYQWTRLSVQQLKLPDYQQWLPADFGALQPRGRARGADVTWRLVSASAGEGYFLVGDAAAVLDPTSSHGVLKAMMTGMMAGHLIKRVLNREVDALHAAEHYCRWVGRWFAHDSDKLREFYAALQLQI